MSKEQLIKNAISEAKERVRNKTRANEGIEKFIDDIKKIDNWQEVFIISVDEQTIGNSGSYEKLLKQPDVTIEEIDEVLQYFKACNNYRISNISYSYIPSENRIKKSMNNPISVNDLGYGASPHTLNTWRCFKASTLYDKIVNYNENQKDKKDEAEEILREVFKKKNWLSEHYPLAKVRENIWGTNAQLTVTFPNKSYLILRIDYFLDWTLDTVYDSTVKNFKAADWLYKFYEDSIASVKS